MNTRERYIQCDSFKSCMIIRPHGNAGDNTYVDRFFFESRTLAELLAFHLVTEARIQSSIEDCVPKPRADSY